MDMNPRHAAPPTLASPAPETQHDGHIDAIREARHLREIREQHGEHVMLGVAGGMSIDAARRRAPLYRPSRDS